MKCSQCGNDNTSDAQFCIGCGTSLGASTANGMKDQLRDKSRDELTYALNSVGVKAEMAERGRAEEKVEDSWYQRSLGVIDTLEGSIRWINILKKDAGQHNPPKWWVVLGIPDERPISSHQEIKIKTVRKKTFPLFGKVVDVIWKGRDGGTGLVNTLSKDVAAKTLAKRIGNLEVKSQANGFQGWTLTVDKRFSPTSQEWETLEKIAGYILSSPRFL
ncbi:MAG: zinc ribbon domain-containing protein [SAR202 cluster bacterium]|nr:zinc ribbon domain-containing protein [SAR202 cluster bacterium]